MTAEVAYENWKKEFKVDMAVRSDFQMFEIGYNIRQEEIKELTKLILDMEKEHKRLNDEVLSLKRKIKTVKGSKECLQSNPQPSEQKMESSSPEKRQPRATSKSQPTAKKASS